MFEALREEARANVLARHAIAESVNAEYVRLLEDRVAGLEAKTRYLITPANHRDFADEVVRLNRDKCIQCIKIVRWALGLGLKEAKDLCDDAVVRYDQQFPRIR